MPIDVGKLTTEVVVTDQSLPLSAAQVEAVVRAVLQRLEEKQRADKLSKETRAVRGSAVEPAK